MDTLMLSDLYKFRKKFLKSAEMQEFLSKREGEIEKCQIQEVKQLMARSARNLWLAIVCKQMVFFIQVGILCLPVIIFWDAINKHVIQKTIKWVDRARFSLDKTLDSPPCDAALA